MTWLTEQRRAYAYRVALAVLAVLTAYGILGPEDVGVWTGVAAAVLGLGSAGLATANTSTKPPPSD